MDNPNPINDALVRQFKQLVDTGKVTFTEVQPPNPRAMRAFDARCEGFMVLIVQANVSDKGETPHVEHQAMGAFTGQFEGNPLLVTMRFTDAEANELFHKAAAKRN